MRRCAGTVQQEENRTAAHLLDVPAQSAGLHEPARLTIRPVAAVSLPGEIVESRHGKPFSTRRQLRAFRPLLCHKAAARRNRGWTGMSVARFRVAPRLPPFRHAPSAFFLRSISRQIIGVKTSCMARSILPPGHTIVFGRDMKESCSIDSK